LEEKMNKLLCGISLAALLCFAFGCQNKAEKAELEKFRAQAKLEEQNLAVVKQEMEAWGKGDFDALRKMVAPEYHMYAPSRSTKPYSIEDEIEWVSGGNAFPDMSMSIEELIAKGDKVVLRYVCKGTHTGEFEGIAATGKQVEYGGIVIFRIENGKIIEAREDNDFWGITQQLGMELKPKEIKK
jgi:steroid delta-isomerase-like uncharacterized protein